jgi:hypothetical protein
MRQVLFLGAALMVGALAASAEPCTVDQRIELAKAGYDKAEVEAMCTAQAAAPQAPPRQLSPDEVLASATYDADDDGPFKRIFSTREKCEFLPDRVRVNNNVKTFGGHYSKLMRYEVFDVGKTQRQLSADRDKGVLSAWISMTAWGIGTANETCYALLIRRSGLAAEDFDSAEASARAEMDAMEQALKAKGVEFD